MYSFRVKYIRACPGTSDFRPVNQYNKAKKEEYRERRKAYIKTMEDIKDENIS